MEFSKPKEEIHLEEKNVQKQPEHFKSGISGLEGVENT